MFNDVKINEETIETLLEKGVKLEKQCKELLMQKKRKEYAIPFNELWDLLEDSENSDERNELAMRFASVIDFLGVICHDSFDFLGLCGAYNDAYSLANIIPESLDMAMTRVRLVIGVLKFKFRFNTFDNVNSYIVELLPVTMRFLDNEEFIVNSAACLCNLLQLCPYDHSVFARCMIEILDQISLLADYFPQNSTLQLTYLRSLVFFVCFAKQRLIDEIYDKYYEKTKDTFILRKAIIEERDLQEMQQALLACNIRL